MQLLTHNRESHWVRMRPILYGLLVAACLVLWAGQALAGKQAYTATYRHAMGDDETRTEARRKCLAGAKRRILEQAGTYVSSSTTVTNYELTDDQITEIAAGVMEVEVLEEKTVLEGDALVISMTVKALLDPDEMRGRLDQAIAEAQAEQSDQEARISELERQLEELKQRQEAAEAAQEAEVADDEDTVVDTSGDTDSVAETLGRLLPAIAVHVLTGMSTERRSDVLRQMDPDARSRLQDQVMREKDTSVKTLQVQPQARPETVRTLPDPRKDPGYDRDRATRRKELRKELREDRRDKDVLYPWTPRERTRQP